MARPPVVTALVALALLLDGCAGESQVAPFPSPPHDYPYAFATPDCAPWDGPAVTVYLLSAAGDSLPPAARHLQISLWMGLPDLPGARFSWPDDSRQGSLLDCASAESCTPIGAGRVRISELSGDSTLWGEVDLVTQAGDSVHGGFRARWRSRRMLCG
jgi:hypothetical protein